MGRTERDRVRMVEEHLVRRGIRDPRVLAAFRAVPREAFVPAATRPYAYADRALPIDCDQTISQPYVVAAMVEALSLGPEARVLDIGTGSGYAAAILAHLAAEVWSIERHEPLARAAADRLARLGFDHVHVVTGDGSLGLPAHAPYDGILVSAAAPRIPRTLGEQLDVGGRLVLPVGTPGEQQVVCVERTGPESWRRSPHGAVRFVPLLGAQGFGGAD